MRAPAMIAVVRTRTPPYSRSSRIGAAFQRGDVECHAVISDRLSTNGAEGFRDRLGAIVA